MTDKEVMQQALDALEKGAWDTLRGRNAAEALRTAIAQPEKEWVGLTDEEMRLIRSDFHGSLDTNAYCRAIQNKLKEKNNG